MSARKKPKGKGPKQAARKERPVRPKAPGKIVTFYSYKGGTGRSLAVANVAWILAAAGRKVLAIDWDLEAPGLHRYFHPFLDDKELADTLGLVDFLLGFVEGARVEASSPTAAKPGPRWFDSYANYLTFAASLHWPFPNGGTLDFMPAGRQDAGYAVKVTRFDWEGFYKDLGGGVFLEAVKEKFRVSYDYVLIDSRTGVSDSSGICTVQMPDDLVLCFTLNGQSILGAEAVAQSAFAQRRRPSGEPGLRVWPVLMRIELAEKERLEAARDFARRTFQRYLTHLPRDQRQHYWGRVEIPYDPFFAYEEVLATFADSPATKLSVLDSLVALTGLLSGGEVGPPPPIPGEERRKVLEMFARRPGLLSGRGAPGSSFYLSYREADRSIAERLGRALNAELGEGAVIWDVQILPGDSWPDVLGEALRRASVVLVLVTQEWLAADANTHARQEVVRALRTKKRVIPILVGVSFEVFGGLPKPLADLGTRLGFWLPPSPKQWGEQLSSIVLQLRQVSEKELASAADTNEEDPHQGQWGGKATGNGRLLQGTVTKAGRPDWFQIDLEVLRRSGRQLSGAVDFYLHPTFSPDVRRVPVKDGRARLTVWGYGAFTVGAEADGGETRLELDLAKVRGAPLAFRTH
jgi:hypothetical protein